MRKLLIILLSAISLTAFAQQKKVAVYVTGEQSGISKVLGDQLATAFAKSGKYSAVERTAAFLSELNKEQNYQRSGAVSDTAIARLGEQFGVHYVCVADMTDAFGEKYVSARLIDVVTAEIVNAHSVSGQMNSMNVCINMASEIANNLTKGTFAEQAEEEKIKAEEEARKKAKAEQQRKEEERQKAEEAAINATLRSQGWIDLGLLSGTLWKDKNDMGGFYTYEQAIDRFGNSIPTKEQFEELINTCRWEWIGNGYNVIGPNGDSIFFPACGFTWCDRKRETRLAGRSGSYWSRTKYEGNNAWFLSFDEEKVKFGFNSCTGLSVRLVK